MEQWEFIAPKTVFFPVFFVYFFTWHPGHCLTWLFDHDPCLSQFPRFDLCQWQIWVWQIKLLWIEPALFFVVDQVFPRQKELASTPLRVRVGVYGRIQDCNTSILWNFRLQGCFEARKKAMDCSLLSMMLEKPRFALCDNPRCHTRDRASAVASAFACGARVLRTFLREIHGSVTGIRKIT